MDGPEDLASQFLNLVNRRGSCRRYDPGRTVPRDAVAYCLEAARLAPSACNRQPWRFVMVDEAEKRRAIYETCRLPGISHAWWRDVPLFVALCADLDLITHRVAPAISGVPYYLIDLGIAGEHFVLAAAERGLGSCWIGWFSEKAVKKVLRIPRRIRVPSLIALGYPADGQAPPGPAARTEAAEIAHWNEWQGAG